ncbi:hypothetical protein [Nodularia spumigena]|uniref:hypothetical protein n=1 Tax=Nodularia spumigena TaxID=70799 RepID=UPI00232B05AD|nr:hypothetical protein [Nodularia spumigena]MDB9317087.1 hypothetical protein [Nodularia spumigena CS-590/01A]MDB9328144.1 hypothetical protein [Nodularia spumigena CS-590/02]MDB9336052.1 hypothetical protein [Nodularia spumigena CS-590/01]
MNDFEIILGKISDRTMQYQQTITHTQVGNFPIFRRNSQSGQIMWKSPKIKASSRI